MPERCVPQAVNFPPTRWLIFAFSPESDLCFLETMIMSYTCRGEALNVIVCLRVLVRTSSSTATFSPLARYSHRARSLSRFFGVLAHPFAHEVDVISQHVELARIGARHSEVVCLLLEAVEPRDHLAHVAPAAAGVCHLVFQESELSVHAQNFRSHRPVIESRQKSHHRVEHC